SSPHAATEASTGRSSCAGSIRPEAEMQAGGGATGSASLLADTARRVPERTALVHGEHSLRYAELETAVDRLSARLQELGGPLEEDFGAAAEPAQPLDAAIAAILYTSGTTGQPKGALVAHVSEVNAGAFLPPVLQLGPSDAALFVVPITHRFGYTSLHATIA